MYSFVKIAVPRNQQECVMLKISDWDSLEGYMKFFAGRAWNGAKECVDRLVTSSERARKHKEKYPDYKFNPENLGEISHLTEPESTILKVMAESESKEDGKYEFHPLKHTSQLIGMRLDMMSSMLRDGMTIIVNEKGGMCDLDSFLKIHKASVTKEIQSEDLVYPKELDKLTPKKVVVLENDNETDFDWKKFMPSEVQWYESKVLNKLKTRQKEEILFYLNHAETIITKTTLLDEKQSEQFLKMFASFKGKNIHIVCESSALEFFMEKADKNILSKLFSDNKVTFYDFSLNQIAIA